MAHGGAAAAAIANGSKQADQSCVSSRRHSRTFCEKLKDR